MSNTIFQPLRTDICQIRLLTLQPNDGLDTQITGRVDGTDLESHPEYEAVSYAWGEKEPTGSMILNGVSLKVPKSLEEALKCFRHSRTPRKLWADAICINQKDTKEKEAQIKLMGSIYRAATRTLVWLGPIEEENDIFVFKTLKRFSHPRPISLQQIILEEAEVWTQIGRCSDPDLDELWDSLSDEKAQRYGKDILPLLSNFFNLCWWGRFWVLEEVALASEALIFWGNEHMDFHQLTSACDRLLIDLRQRQTTLYGIWSDEQIQDFRDLLAVSMNTAKQVKLISDRIRSPAGQMSQRDMCLLVIAMLAMGRTRNAYHCCDKVFGLLGLFPPALMQSFQPSYTKSTELVFQDTAFKLIDLSKSFMLFNCIREGQRYTPSWCPVWDYRYHQLQDFNLRAQQEPLFKACQTFSWYLSRQLSPPVLEVKGFRLDRLTRKCQPDHDLLDAATLFNFLEKCVRYADDNLFEIGASEFYIDTHRQEICSTRYITGGNVLEAVCKMAFNDCEPSAQNGLIQRLRAENSHHFYRWLLNMDHVSLYDQDTIASAEKICFQGVEHPSMCAFARSVTNGKAFFTTKLGYAGLVDDDYADCTGEVWILAGGSQPVVLQPVLGQQGSFLRDLRGLRTWSHGR